MFNKKKRSQSNKIHQRNQNKKSAPKYKEINEQKSKKDKLILNQSNSPKKGNKSNSHSNNSSLSQKKEKNDIKKIESEIKKERKIDEELIKQQYKIIKDFLIPILKEQNAKELVSCYNKMSKVEKKLMKKNKTISLRNKPILEYSFVSGKSRKKLKIPLFQILSPNQYKNYMDKKNKERITTVNRPCKNLSFLNINNINISDSRKIKNSNNKIKSTEISGLNNNTIKYNNIYSNNKLKKYNYNNINNELKNSLLLNNIETTNIKTSIKKKEITLKQNKNNKISLIDKKNKNNNLNIKQKRSKTPPLYLRLNEVKKNHDFIMEKLKQKYEYNYKRNNNNKDTNKKSEEDITSSEMSDSSSSINKTQTNSGFEKWYNNEKTWQKMRDTKLNIIKSELEENKICQNIYNKKQETFKPKINKNSDNLLMKKYDGDFYSRLKDYQMNKEKKEKILRQKMTPNFQPFINYNYHINEEYYLYMKYDQKKINEDLNNFL